MGDLHFLCDSMLGGLARSLRAVGYDAAFAGPIDDGVLVEWARASGAMLLSSDGPLFERRVVRDGRVAALYVPRVSVHAQTVHVLRALGLSVREPCCMACGGALIPVPKASVRERVPSESWACFDRFWECARCTRLLWKGTHWDRIEALRHAVASAVESGG